MKRTNEKKTELKNEFDHVPSIDNVFKAIHCVVNVNIIETIRAVDDNVDHFDGVPMPTQRKRFGLNAQIAWSLSASN